ncbi:hypothetical protein DB35_06135 [Streptomyces abyssalis]|uniref:Tripartite ATP-independent periplasmic transporters DctQ component domain-containing protein n=1 Tax=Streptomyces abyssalis TaxID=933944 RepID=A0A1E7JTA6_9ACTN|nr:TRAP transporter small permease [Streptomyces abyssalis]OEU92091.1 hypothetical protein AN215_06620 [Streptomyces abyssalis]OEU94629.1 hypothetical protein DB35_06135 [Streptomyces abyssalis]OEV31460.1 hypothetical protein AN219_04815 [Streptomyces nanshensis]
MSALNSLRKYVLACALALAVVAMAVVGLMMLTITYDVIVRYALAAPTDWAYPLNAAGLLAATSLAVPYFYAKGQHISMDLVHRALPSGLRRAADLVTAAATLFLGLVLAVTAFRSMAVAIKGGLTGAGTFSIPLWVPDAVLFTSGVLLAVVAVLFPPGTAEDVAEAEHPPGEAPSTGEAPGDAPATAAPSEGAPARGEGRAAPGTGEGETRS